MNWVSIIRDAKTTTLNAPDPGLCSHKQHSGDSTSLQIRWVKAYVQHKSDYTLTCLSLYFYPRSDYCAWCFSLLSRR